MTDLTTPLAAETPVVSLGGKLGLMPDAAGNDALGLAVDSPSPFTLLGRLKAVAAAVTAGASSIVAAITGTLDVSAQSLPLPTGAATDAGLAALHTQLAGTLAVNADALPLPAGAATAARQDAQAAIGTEVYVLADGTAGLAAGASTAPVLVPRGGYYFFDASFAGSSPSLKLQRLGADGATWIDVVTRTAVGSGDPIGIPSQSSLRLTNAGAGALTAVAGRLG